MKSTLIHKISILVSLYVTFDLAYSLLKIINGSFILPISSLPVISLIAPMYNEEEVIDLFFDAVSVEFSKIEAEYEIICINDGSSDQTLSKLKDRAATNKRIKIVNLSRNYGKETALTAGLDYCIGDAAIPIDCDMQDPPELIGKMIEEWVKGFDMVLAKRVDRKSDSKLKRVTSNIFYKLLDKISDISIPNNVGDFRLLDRKVIDALKLYRERARFMKGLFASLGFKQTTIEYTRPARVAGTTKWNYLQLYKLALEGIISFTSLPLKIWSYLGASISISTFLYGIYLVIKTLIFGVETPGYASLMVVTLCIGGLILMCLGIIGEYLARIFIEVKQRPLYLIQEVIGFDKPE
jgi:glycosyltransferase involved in cell wall biosynthesis